MLTYDRRVLADSVFSVLNPPPTERSLISEMTATAQKEIASKALALPKEARERLAHQLLESLDPPEEKISRKEWNRLWKAELETRLEEMESGKVKGIPAAKVMAELRAKYG